MSTFAHAMRRVIRRGGEAPAAEAAADRRPRPPVPPSLPVGPAVEIAPNDPLLAYLQTAGGVVEVDRLELAVAGRRRAARRPASSLVVPLVSGGELVGTLNLGPRLSDQQYSTDDKRLLDSLAAQAAPALQVAELVRRQAAEAASRERIEQELRVAQLIQQNFLPRVLPELPGWQLDAYYKPAREVGGDFYDFFDLPDGQLGVVVGDVTDKGVPAAMVMAAARSVLRAIAAQVVAPGETLAARQRAALPRHPRQDVRHLPVRRDRSRLGPLPVRERRPQPAVRAHRRTAPAELRATGMPLGLLPGMQLRGEGGVDRPGRGAAALLRRRHRGALDRRARCTARRGSPSSSRAARS